MREVMEQAVKRKPVTVVEQVANRAIQLGRNKERSSENPQELARRRSLFLASMGHTLRSPLNGVLGFSEMLLGESAGSLNDRQRRYVERIEESGRRQLELIDNLMQLARLQAGLVDLRPSRCTLDQIVAGAIEPYRVLARRKRVAIAIDVADPVDPLVLDVELVTTALRSLVSNAVRYTLEGGHVSVKTQRLHAQPANGNGWQRVPEDRLHIEVLDDGPGIDPEDQGLIFDDLDSDATLRARRQRRSGVGLPLARRLVELHDGRIGVSSSGVKGEGSRFFIELPVKIDLEVNE